MDYSDGGLDAFSTIGGEDCRQECHNCGRKFNSDVLNRHIPICTKTKQRKAFDSSKQRAEGTEINTVVKKSSLGGSGGRGKPQQQHRPDPNRTQQNQPIPKKSNWRAKHEDFINTIRGARQVQAAMDKGLPLPPPPPPTINPDYVQCPFCSRRFNETAAQRHINFCKEQSSRLPRDKPNSKATMKQSIRTQYQAPKPKGRNAPSTLSVGAQRYGNTATSPTSPNASAGRTQQSRRADRDDVEYGGIRMSPIKLPRGYRSLSRSPVNPSGSSRMSSTQSAGSRGGGRMGSSNGMRDYDNDPSSGRALRTGRNAEVYSEARELVPPGGRKQQSRPQYDSSRYSGGNFDSPSPTSSRSYNNPDSGYHSHGDDSHHASSYSKGRMGSAAKFCHDCGSKYPVATAKFCCECGIRRMNVS